MKLYIETLGCPKNFNDSEGLAGIWEKAGHEVTDEIGQADVIVVNTCGFINDAKRESIDKIFDVVRFRDESGNDPIIVVSGCLSQRYSGDLFESIPEVDIFTGVNEYERFPQIIEEYRKSTERKVYQSLCPNTFEEFSARKLSDTPYSETLRIAEGCNNRCAYCVIPLIRGGYRSRPMESIVEEAEKLAAAGTRELLLIAQDVTEYGRDIYGRLALPELLKRLCRVDGIRWIRLMYCYEDKITDELIEVMAAEEKICNYIDIPLQHVSDNVLKAMRRRSTSASIRDTIARLRKAIPDIHIRTTFITGFPGETEEEHGELLDFVKEVRFERLGVFAYSKEEGTPASRMKPQITAKVKKERRRELMLLQQGISSELRNAMIGRTEEVIVEGYLPDDGVAVGRTRGDAPNVDGMVFFGTEGELVTGSLVKVRITGSSEYDLYGEMLCDEDQ